MNRSRNKLDAEYEILDTGIFNDSRYFDVLVTYAKQTDRDIFIRIEVTNRYKEEAELTVLPTLWFYNRWAIKKMETIPQLTLINKTSIKATHEYLGTNYFYFHPAHEVLFTDNETNHERITGQPNPSIFVKDAINDAIVHRKNVQELKDRKMAPNVLLFTNSN